MEVGNVNWNRGCVPAVVGRDDQTARMLSVDAGNSPLTSPQEKRVAEINPTYSLRLRLTPLILCGSEAIT
jgi:hypothetical protein